MTKKPNKPQKANMEFGNEFAVKPPKKETNAKSDADKSK